MNPEAAVDYSIVPLLMLLTSLLPGAIIFFLREDRTRLRTALNLFGALSKVAFVVVLIPPVVAGEKLRASMEWAPGIDIVLTTDAFSLFFVGLSAALWLVTTIYAIGYLGGSPNQSRFFGFFSLCVTATTGIALSGSLLTFFLFYELLTLSTWPLVVHKGDAKSLAAGRRYLAYTMTGSVALLAGIVWLEGMTGPVEFVRPDALDQVDDWALRAVFVLCVGGLGVKAALVPLHGWLPGAMAAPAPVSALLHAVAVVKAGAFGIVRLIYDVYGSERVAALALGVPLAVLASVTILYGSIRALQQADIKRRLAYSTVSQVAYIALGASLAGPVAAIGGLTHLVHQGLMKITLFFAAGALAERLGVQTVSQLDGAGRRMPWTVFAFSIGALGMIGVPPVAGFVSKWYLGLGGLAAGQPWVLGVLVLSSLLNAAYFLPLLYRAWFRPPSRTVADAGDGDGMRLEVPWQGLILPALVTALCSLAAGLFAALALSPLGWARLIVERFY